MQPGKFQRPWAGSVLHAVAGCGAKRKKTLMHSTARRGMVLGAGALMCFCAMSRQVARRTGQDKTAAGKKAERKPDAAAAYRLNTLGVAHLNQQRPADAQKYFEQALQADAKFAVARLNLGVALLGQQKLEAARAALTEATEQ